MLDFKELTGVVSGDRYLDHTGLTWQSGQATAALIDLGVRPGDTVALLMRNDIAFVVATRAIIAAGAFPVPLNWHSTSDNCAYVLKDCGARLLLAHADLARRVADAVPAGCRLLAFETPVEVARAFGLPDAVCTVPEGVGDWNRLMSGTAVSFAQLTHIRGAVIYTSGTTGHPKGVKRVPVAADGAQTSLRIMDQVFGVERSETVRTLVAGPLYHAAPNFWGLRSSEPGSLLVLQPRFDAEAFLGLIERYRITHTFVVPTMMIRLLKLPPEIRGKYDLSSLRRVVHSAAPVSQETKRAMIDWLGPIIWEFYGGTENGTVTIADTEEWLAHPGTVGRPLSNCRVEILDDRGNPLPPGQTGEIFAYNFDLPPFEYINLPGTREKSEIDSLFSIGDVGYLDDDGFLYLCDRKKDMIISGGVNIYPAEIENALQTMPAVMDSAVFGIPHPDFGEAVCAHVQPEPGAMPTAGDILAWLGERVPRQNLPKQIVIVDSLPREASGKIMKRRIRDDYWKDEGRSI